MIGYKPDKPKSPTEREMAEFLMWLDGRKMNSKTIRNHDGWSMEMLREICLVGWEGFDIETRYHMEIADDKDAELEYFLLGLGYEC